MRLSGLRHVLLALLPVACAAESRRVAPPPALVLAPPPAPPAPRTPAPPATPKAPVATTYHGVTVTDAYAWLEDGSDPKVVAWSDAENAFTRSYLDALPDRPAIKARVAALLGDDSPSYGEVLVRGRTLFARKTQPPKQQGFLVTRDADASMGHETILVDPNALDPSGKTTIDWFVPSRDGTKVAVSLSSGGSESGDVHVYDVATGRERATDTIPRVNGGTAGGSLAWAGDSGFFYTRYPHEGERPAADLSFYQQVYFHKLGGAIADDAYAVGKDFPRIAEVALEASPDGAFVLARVANGDGGEFALYVHATKGPATKWTQLSTFADKVVDGKFGPDDRLYLLSHGRPRGQVLRLDRPTGTLAAAKVVVPESDVVIASIVPAKGRLYVIDRVGGPSQVRVVPSGGAAAPTLVPIPAVSSVSDGEPLADGDLLFRDESYVEPPAWYRYAAGSGKVEKTPLFQRSPADFGDAEVVREACTSKDGTKVPVSILQKKGAVRDGSGYALLTGYGGFGIAIEPHFRPITRLLLDQGLAFAEANLRGGSEFGEAWHDAGRVLQKQNVFDDFYGCARLLADEKIAPPAHLAAQGRSNGGLLMGAELVQHPDAFKVVLAHVGIHDMLRYESTFNGAFNVTEYGSVKDEAQFKALYAYSPFHNVKDGVSYPSTLLLTGANDPRVEPYNSRKMAARLQAATSGPNPILLRTSHDTGHGMGTPLGARVEEDTDWVAFLLHELGVTYRR